MVKIDVNRFLVRISIKNDKLLNFTNLVLAHKLKIEPKCTILRLEADHNHWTNPDFAYLRPHRRMHDTHHIRLYSKYYHRTDMIILKSVYRFL